MGALAEFAGDGSQVNFEIDLQLFSQEKTEPATPRRRQLARERGQIFASQDLVSAVSLLASVVCLRATMGYTVRFLSARISDMLAALPPAEPGIGWARAVLSRAFLVAAVASAPVLAASMVAGLAASMFQVGFNFRPGLLSPDFGRINPGAGLARIFSRKSLEAMLRSLAKIAVVALVAWNVIRSHWSQLVSLAIRDPVTGAALLKDVTYRMLMTCSLALVFLGGADWVYQWWEYERGLMMTPRELREELRETEVKPEVRSAMRQRQRQFARRRMMQDVPTADVVVVNPAHYAVALRYDAEKDPAPVVVAKGVDHVALRIKAIAMEHGVHIFEDPALARSLYSAVDVGEMIPEELYRAVAEVLAYVYRLSGKVPGKGGTR